MELPLYIKAILMGLVEGLTEYLPVSSTGHLILFGDAITFNDARALVFDVVIQMGAIAAVLVAYFKKFSHVAVSFFTEKKSRNFIWLLLLAFLPAAVFGALLHSAIKAHLFNSTVVAYSLIIGGIIMVIIDRMPLKEKVIEVDAISFTDAIKIGFFQCLAMIPGVSRSGATIIGGMVAGLNKQTAAEFSFFLAVPTLTAAAIYDLYKNWSVLSMDDLGLMAIGFVSSFVFAMLVITVFIKLIVRFGFTPFAIYRILLGAAILWLVP
ncbi:MAG: undecaprenyl-diphosphate phosphatase [Alphaproteobacteria bacterium]|nr:undecaprenyl-diphosphate phosphatase [Alphaproteobacteria bacterium]